MAYCNEPVDEDELLSMEVEDLFDDSEAENSYDVNIASNKASNEDKQKYCKHCQQLVSKSTYYRHKTLYCGDDWSDSSTEIDGIFDVNHDSDSEAPHSGGDSVEVGSLSLDYISESPTVRAEGNVESTQALESVRENTKFAENRLTS